MFSSSRQLQIANLVSMLNHGKKRDKTNKDKNISFKSLLKELTWITTNCSENENALRCCFHFTERKNNLYYSLVWILIASASDRSWRVPRSIAVLRQQGRGVDLPLPAPRKGTFQRRDGILRRSAPPAAPSECGQLWQWRCPCRHPRTVWRS